MPDPLDYTSPSTQRPVHKRTAATWVVLLVVWVVGVAVWAIYISLAVVLLRRLM